MTVPITIGYIVQSYFVFEYKAYIDLLNEYRPEEIKRRAEDNYFVRIFVITIGSILIILWIIY